MKELNTFRNFLNENKGIAADYADRILGAGEGIDPIALIDFYAGNLDDLPEPMKADLFMANLEDIKARVMQENELHEGTWSLGSPEQIGSIIDGLVAIRQKADDAMDEPDAAGRGFVDGLKNQLNAEGWNSRIYKIVGDDSFHDYYDAAKKAAQLNDFDRVKNALGDAIARAKELQNAILKNRDLEEGEVEESFIGDLATRIRKRKAAKKEKERFTKGLDMKRGGAPEIDPEFTKGLEENDDVLDEMLDEVNSDYFDGFSAEKPPIEKVLKVLKKYISDVEKLNRNPNNKETADALAKILKRLGGFSGSSFEDIDKNVKLEEIKENDAVLDEVIEEATIFDEIDNNMKLIAVHMSAADALEDIVAEFQAISGGTKLLAQVLRNVVADNNLTGDAEEYASIGFEE